MRLETIFTTSSKTFFQPKKSHLWRVKAEVAISFVDDKLFKTTESRVMEFTPKGNKNLIEFSEDEVKAILPLGMENAIIMVNMKVLDSFGFR